MLPSWSNRFCLASSPFKTSVSEFKSCAGTKLLAIPPLCSSVSGGIGPSPPTSSSTARSPCLRSTRRQSPPGRSLSSWSWNLTRVLRCPMLTSVMPSWMQCLYSSASKSSLIWLVASSRTVGNSEDVIAGVVIAMLLWQRLCLWIWLCLRFKN